MQDLPELYWIRQNKDLTTKNFLEGKGYLAPYETPINTIFVHRDCWEKML